MKRRFLLISLALISIILMITIVGCTRDTTADEKKVIKGFTETFYTTPGKEMDIFKKYLTKEAYDSLTMDFYASSRNQYGPRMKGNMEGIEISNMTIEPIEDDNKDYHYYQVSLNLKNSENNKEEDVSYKMSLEKFEGQWKLGLNNQFQILLKFIWKMWKD